MGKLDGKVAIVTGAGSGLGRDLALRLASEGCAVGVLSVTAANVEKTVPRNFISQDGFGITGACRKYLEPLIGGEDYPPYRNGLPVYAKLKAKGVRRKLKGEYSLK